MDSNLSLELRGKNLSAVVFVQDYLQLQFDGAILTFMIFPTIEFGNCIISIEDSDYRNKLCEMIGKEVADVLYQENIKFSLLFEELKSISCSLNPEDYIAPEMIIFENKEEQRIVIF